MQEYQHQCLLLTNISSYQQQGKGQDSKRRAEAPWRMLEAAAGNKRRLAGPGIAAADASTPLAATAAAKRNQEGNEY